jgi:hypothetical protein
MGAEKPISVPENIKFTGENTNITYKQERNLKKKNIHKTQTHSKPIRNTWEGM